MIWKHSITLARALKRWADAIWLGVVAAPIGFALTMFVARATATWTETQNATLFWSLAASTVAFICIASHKRLRAFLGVIHFFVRPPASFSALIGTMLTLGLVATSRDVRELLELRDLANPAWLSDIARSIGIAPSLHPSLVAVIPFCLLALAAVAQLGAAILTRLLSWCVALASRSFQKRAKEVPTSTQALTYEMVKRWTESDAASADLDLFDVATMAERIARRLSVKGSKPPSIAIIGDYGSGKTTVRKMVATRLDRRSNMIVPVELWPYENAEAAAAGILSTLIDALGREVGVLHLRGLPAAYADAIASGGSFFATLSRLLVRERSSPKDIVDQIDFELSAINVRYILWVEDLDRFANARSGSDEKLGPLRALLSCLDSATCISVITATKSLDTRMDLEKIARFVERMPEMTSECVAPILRTVCVEFQKPFDILSRDPQANKRALLRDDDDQNDATFRQALARLARTPRLLKAALREAIETQGILEGEIDPEDLIVLSILKHADPTMVVELESEIRNQSVSRREDATPKPDRPILDYVLKNRRPQSVKDQRYLERVLVVPLTCLVS